MRMRAIAARLASVMAVVSAGACLYGVNTTISVALALAAAALALWSSFDGGKVGGVVGEASPLPVQVDSGDAGQPEPLASEPAPDDEKPDTAAGFADAARLRLRFADAVLAKVPEQTEEAVFSLIERLVAIRDESARTAKISSATDASADGTGQPGTNEILALAESARATIQVVRAALVNMRQHDKSAATGLAALGKELNSGMELLAGIEEITERSRLIAINMAIEAARIGSQGNGFKVIVNELRKLNDKIADFSKQVAELLGKFKSFNESLIQNSLDGSAIVTKEVE
ncbi:MAG: hypothetical protein JXM71_00800, partial [Spirochaetales bacterium]|nr:hypothetical protein [Spirochaetales bacterium]